MVRGEEREQLLEELRAIRKTNLYRALERGPVAGKDAADLRSIAETFRARVDGSYVEDQNRLRLEKKAFQEGWIPAWLLTDYPAVVGAEAERLALRGEPERSVELHGRPTPQDLEFRETVQRWRRKLREARPWYFDDESYARALAIEADREQQEEAIIASGGWPRWLSMLPDGSVALDPDDEYLAGWYVRDPDLAPDTPEDPDR